MGPVTRWATVAAAATLIAGCGTPRPKTAPQPSGDGNPLGPSYVLMPLPGEDDSMLGRVLPAPPEAGRSLEETARANPCADKLAEKRESALASTFEYAEEIAGSAKAGAMLGTFGFSADARRATHFVYRLGTDKRVSVVDTAEYATCCAEKGCGYGYISALIHGDGEYATGEESAANVESSVLAVGSASGGVTLNVLSKRKVRGYIAAVITVTKAEDTTKLGPLGIAQEAGIDEPTVGGTTKEIYEREKISIEPLGTTWVFVEGRAYKDKQIKIKENEFIRRYRDITRSDELDDLEQRRNTGGVIAFGTLTLLGIGAIAGGAASGDGLGVAIGGVVGAGLTIGFGIPFFIALGKPDGSLTSHYLTEREARLYLDRYNRALLRNTIKDVQKAHRESALPPPPPDTWIGLGPTGITGSF
jgi:hypothetical protein